MKISKLKKGDIVLITWIDSIAKGGWYSEREIEDFIECDKDCYTAGYFYRTINQFIILYMNTYGDEIGNLTIIPKTAIINIKLLKRSK